MKWSTEQDNALKHVADWLANPDQQVLRLFGYAGTGKTTLAKHFAEGVEGNVMFGAYTGKAAHVLQSKGCGGASTIHSMIYNPKDKSRAKLRDLEAELAEVLHELRLEDPERNLDDERTVKTLRTKIKDERDNQARPMFTLNTDSEVKRAKLVVIDECSMVDDRMGEDLLSFGTKVLVLGDPAQLPPVGGAGFFTEGHKPDIMLEDIHRQAKDNPIIEMATKVRNQQELSLGNYGSSRVVLKSQIDETDALAAGQILVGRNKTRTATNRRVRALLGHQGTPWDDLPIPGDRLVCLRNNHDEGLLNGAIWTATDIGETGDERVTLTAKSEDTDLEVTTECHAQYFFGRGEQIHWFEKKEANEFDYGYALTVHKAQGSQWDNVLLFDESHCFRKDKWKWLYTGLTRAAKTVTVVEM